MGANLAWTQGPPHHGKLSPGRAASSPDRAVGQDGHPFSVTQTLLHLLPVLPGFLDGSEGWQTCQCDAQPSAPAHSSPARRVHARPSPAHSGRLRTSCCWSCTAPCHFAKDNNDFAAFPEIFSEPVFSCSTQYCCIIWSVSSSFFGCET